MQLPGVCVCVRERETERQRESVRECVTEAHTLGESLLTSPLGPITMEMETGSNKWIKDKFAVIFKSVLSPPEPSRKVLQQNGPRARQPLHFMLGNDFLRGEEGRRRVHRHREGGLLPATLTTRPVHLGQVKAWFNCYLIKYHAERMNNRWLLEIPKSCGDGKRTPNDAHHFAVKGGVSS